MIRWVKRNFLSRRAPIFCVDRLRINTDGEGVTTLVTFYRCPLRCKYCLNRKCFVKPKWYDYLSAENVCRTIAIDNIYFQSTGGGVTFGGGEPLLYPEFISEFKACCNPAWKINIETSLNVKLPNLKRALPFVSTFFVDVKDINPQIYRSYTGASNRCLIENLEYLSSIGAQERVVIRVPLIKGFNSAEDQDRSEEFLRSLGYTRFDRFEYVVR